MPVYRTTKDFHLGALRMQIQAGETLEFDGSVVRIRDRTESVPGFAAIIDAGLVELLEAGTAIARPVAPRRAAPIKPLPAHTDPDKKHKWESNGLGLSGQTCRTCGVTMQALGLTSNIQTDRSSLGYQYTDAYGVMIESLTELPCPVFVGHMGGAVAGTTHRVRKLTNRVETIDERVTRLEQENAALREQAGTRQAEALDLLRRLTAATEQLAVESRPALPDHGQIVDVFDFEEAEVVPVKTLEEEVDDLLADVPLD